MRHLKRQRCIPPQEVADFVVHMEDLLDSYAQPYDPLRPVICLDELPNQLLADVRKLLSVRPRIPARKDYRYERRSVRNLFLLV